MPPIRSSRASVRLPGACSCCRSRMVSSLVMPQLVAMALAAASAADTVSVPPGVWRRRSACSYRVQASMGWAPSLR